MLEDINNFTFHQIIVFKKNPFLTSLPWAGCCWQDGSADHHLALPGQHLQRDQQQLTQRQGGRHFKLIPYPPL